MRNCTSMRQRQCQRRRKEAIKSPTSDLSASSEKRGTSSKLEPRESKTKVEII